MRTQTRELFAEGYIGEDIRPYLRFSVEGHEQVFDGLFLNNSHEGILVPRDVFNDLLRRQLIRNAHGSVSHVTNIIIPETQNYPVRAVRDVPISYGRLPIVGQGFFQRIGPCTVDIDFSDGKKEFKIYRR